MMAAAQRPADLVRREISLAPWSRYAGAAGSGGELWYLIAGRGLLDAGPAASAVGPDTGLWLPPGTRYRFQAGQGEAAARATLAAVALPAAAHAASSGAAPRISQLRNCQVERAGDRRFRVLLGPGRGCRAATQFVGEIPPGRAPEHSHPYDEIVLVLAGSGAAHTADGDRPVRPGSWLHLPPGLPHCLENTGEETLVVLGVFHPGGSPASAAESPRKAGASR